jgi:hypothetical protein
METLTTQETVRLCELERIIQKGKDTFVEVGTALAEIRQSRIYRATWKTFEDYCQERWNFSRVRAHQMIEAAQAVEDVKSSLHGTPKSSVQAEKLAKVTPEKREEVWNKANEAAKQEGKPVAARHVEAAVAEVMPKEAEEDQPLVVDGTQNEEPAKEEPKETEKFLALKTAWNKATKKDRIAFAAWINKNWKL